MLGGLAATVSGTEAFEGFHTVDLPSLVILSPDEDFYVELQTSNGGQANDGDISLQRLLDFQNVSGDAYTTQQCESFYSDDGTTWADLYDLDSTHSENFAIDALTVAPPEPSSISLLAAAAACGWGRRALPRRGAIQEMLLTGGGSIRYG